MFTYGYVNGVLPLAQNGHMSVRWCPLAPLDMIPETDLQCLGSSIPKIQNSDLHRVVLQHNFVKWMHLKMTPLFLTLCISFF